MKQSGYSPVLAGHGRFPLVHERDTASPHQGRIRGASSRADRGHAWQESRRSIFDMTEGRRALASWQYEHGDIGHKAERAAYGAALGIFARDRLKHDQYVTLVRPMAEALPWLLPETPPRPHE